MAGHYFIVKRKPPAMPVVLKSFSYAENKISERSEEQLLKLRDKKSNKFRKPKRGYPTAISIAVGHLMRAKEKSMSL